MRIHRKISVVLALVFIGFGGVAAAVLYAQHLADQVHDLELRAERATASVFRLSDRSAGLLLSDDAFSSELDAWESALDRFSDDFLDLDRHPAVGRVDRVLRERLNLAIARFNVVERQAGEVRRLSERMLEDEDTPVLFPGQEAPPGIHAMIREIEAGPAAGTPYAARLNRLQTQVMNLRSIIADFVADEFAAPMLGIRAQAEQLVFAYRVAAISGGAVVLVALIVLGVFFGRGLARRITGIESRLNLAGDGDLTVRVEERGRDELAALGGHVNYLLDSFATFIRHVREASSRVDSFKDQLSASSSESAASAHQIAENIRGSRTRMEQLDSGVAEAADAAASIAESLRALAERVHAQTESVVETAASIEEMVASVRNSAQLAVERNERSERLASVIREGGELVGETNEAVRQMAREVEDILEITEIINAISQQTDLLSMNAAIESAHAGEAGRGFGVVAEEIRKLAESTSENSRQIDQALKAMAERISAAAEASEKSAGGFEEIDAETRETATAMREIAESMSALEQESRRSLETTAKMQEFSRNLGEESSTMLEKTERISRSADEARNLSRQVTEAITEIDSGAQEIRESISHTSEVAEESRAAMLELQSLVQRFVVGEKSAE